MLLIAERDGKQHYLYVNIKCYKTKMGKKRLELSILSAPAFETGAYILIPPFAQSIAGGRIELPRCRAHEAREQQPVLQPAILFDTDRNRTCNQRIRSP